MDVCVGLFVKSVALIDVAEAGRERGQGRPGTGAAQRGEVLGSSPGHWRREDPRSIRGWQRKCSGGGSSSCDGFLSWDISAAHVDLEKELQALAAQAPEGEEARNDLSSAMMPIRALSAASVSSAIAIGNVNILFIVTSTADTAVSDKDFSSTQMTTSSTIANTALTSPVLPAHLHSSFMQSL
ncbi:Uncharacterized protein GBIM_08150 [Gryllus bimaculatus]|nr:Uncharacterized protein GBIM_08150 [Gryllus bimaculatus]